VEFLRNEPETTLIYTKTLVWTIIPGEWVSACYIQFFEIIYCKMDKFVTKGKRASSTERG